MLSIGRGVLALSGREHETLQPLVPLAALTVGLLMDGWSFLVGTRQARRDKGPLSYWQYIQQSKTPEVPVVVLEDTAALVGLFFAYLGVGLTVLTGNPVFDATASILIGLLPATISLILAREMRSLLIGEAATAEEQDEIRSAIIEHSEVCDIVYFRSRPAVLPAVRAAGLTAGSAHRGDFPPVRPPVRRARISLRPARSSRDGRRSTWVAKNTAVSAEPADTAVTRMRRDRGSSGPPSQVATASTASAPPPASTHGVNGAPVRAQATAPAPNATSRPPAARPSTTGVRPREASVPTHACDASRGFFSAATPSPMRSAAHSAVARREPRLDVSFIARLCSGRVAG